jgi:hypothetical protein
MIYVMSWKAYWSYIDDGMTHEGLIKHLNRTLGLRGTITRIEVTKD